MEFRIADTLTGSMARLSGDEQKAVKTTAFDLQMRPENPGHQMHRIERSHDPHFWSVRVNHDLRLIVHKTAESLLLCFAAHHDAAYQWAERRRLETHPKTGAAQLVEVLERVEEVVVTRRIAPRAFEHISDSDLLAYWTPPAWLAAVREATEESLLEVLGHLPARPRRPCSSSRPALSPRARRQPRRARARLSTRTRSGGSA